MDFSRHERGVGLVSIERVLTVFLVVLICVSTAFLNVVVLGAFNALGAPVVGWVVIACLSTNCFLLIDRIR